MVQSDLGRWDPLPLASVVELFAAAPFRWWISGGIALELFLDRSWRDRAWRSSHVQLLVANVLAEYI